MQFGRWWVVVLALACAGCGGGADAVKNTVAQIAELTAKADAAEQLARSVAQDTPCASNDQCSVLTFLSPTSGCMKSSLAYSLPSATAGAAREATTQQNTSAKQAADLQPLSGGACILSIPFARCVANRCTTGS